VSAASVVLPVAVRAVVGSPRRSEALAGALGGEGALQRRITAGLVSLGLLISSAAFGDDDQVYSREGPYLGFEALLAIENSHDRLDVSETGGLAGRIGFRLTREFAMEIEGEWAYLDGRNPWSLSTVAKLYPVALFDEDRTGFLDDRLQPYIVSSVGIIAGDFDRGHDPAATFRIGGGSDFWLTEDLAATGQVVYVGNAGDASDYDTVNLRLGITWRY
jgi:hypothetical protein